jgi:3-Ketosteroid 9alpha-hydroxylase C-terminal domain
MDRDHYFVAGFAMKAPAPAELVTENGFDSAHFRPVHDVRETPELTVVNGTVSELRAEGTFVVPRSLWQRGEGDILRVPYTARGLSPGIILSHLGGEHPYYVLTAATPLGRRECIIRLSLAFPAAAQAGPPDNTRCEYVLTQSRKGLEKDLIIWQNMVDHAPQRLTSEDKTVMEFRRYVSRFPMVT